MKYCLYAIYDRSVQGFNAPVSAPNELLVRRSLQEMFEAELQKPSAQRHSYVRYHADHDLYLIGYHDGESGSLEPVSPIQRVCSLSEFVGIAPDVASFNL